MDRHVEESLESARRLQRSIDQQAEQAMQQAREGGSNIVIRQQEQRGNGSYS
jgi:UTP-glucose-1-phosphate uridylyltransferase